MKITLCGSSSFRGGWWNARTLLQRLGHEAIIHPWYDEWAAGRTQERWEQVLREHAAVKKRHDIIRQHHQAIVGSDAVLVLNFDKKMKRYVGDNTLTEMGYAHAHLKKVFLLNPVPEIGYQDWILVMVTGVLYSGLKIA